MNLICYSSGGLGNRLRGLSSCYALSLLTNRKLQIIWDPALRCISNFNELYANNYELTTRESMSKLEEYKIYSIAESINNELYLNGYPELVSMAKQNGYYNIENPNVQHQILQDPVENIIICSNNFIVGSDQKIESKFLAKLLIPVKEVSNKIKSEQKKLKLNKKIVGVHARATDFIDVSTSFYIDQMININADKFFVCSDSLEVEHEIKEKFNEKIILRDSKEHVSKQNSEMSWVNNVRTSLESVKDAMVDMYLLAKTNFLVYDKRSSFSDIVRKMQ
jgi:hypothetical protein